MIKQHTSVLLDEAVASLITDTGGFYIDGTFGRGGHSRLILNNLSPEGHLLATDKDDEAIAIAQQDFAADGRFEIIKSSFADVHLHLQANDLMGKVNGMLLDLGVSSPQLDQAERGFSFQHDGPLDMRMDNSSGETAAQWVARASEADMAQVFKTYGEERYAKRIARAIVSARTEASIETTKTLAGIVAEAHPAWEKHKHPATRVFQAIRIHINNELKDLESFLAKALDILAPGGRLVVISFHSLEDSRVKNYMRKQARGDDFPPGVPITEDQLNKRMEIISKAAKPGEVEVQANPRARSAVMRVAQKIK